MGFFARSIESGPPSMERKFRPRLRQPLTKGQPPLFEQGHQNPSVAAGEHTTPAPALAAHLLVLPNVYDRLLGLGRRLRAATDPQQPEGCHGDGQPQPLGPFRVFHPRMLPLPTAPLAVL